jgi:alginate O-acetyltransferase complex protein AlgI
MLFNSLEFALFFPIVSILYFVLQPQLRTPMLLVASCIFYMAFIPAYILILIVTILIDYTAGIYLERTTGPIRKAILGVSIVATCAVLFVFKYYAFFTTNFVGFAGWWGWHLTTPSLNFILPIGLSFHTFQSLSYVVEVYRHRQAPEKNFIIYATYVMFFPQLVAGPIERPYNLLHQFYEHHSFDYLRVTSGLKRMAWGFFKKVVIADRLALYVKDVYADPQHFNGLQLTIATFFFAFQIYCDFSGYSDIAIGSARVLGFRLMENFDNPYLSQSISEFWHRWHISLSSWFRDYVYIPMGGSHVSRPRWFLNLVTVFAISGLWHGASWTFVVWGVLNGVYLVSGVLTANLRNRFFASIGLSERNAIRVGIRILTTFLLICIGWVVFRAPNIGAAWYILTHFWQGWDFGSVKTEQFLLRQMPVAIACIVLLEVIQWLNRRVRLTQIVGGMPFPVRWAVYIGFVFIITLFGVYRSSQFIYFQF